MKEILLIGGSGYLGRHLIEKFGIDNVIPTYFNNVINDGVFFDFASPGLKEIIFQNKGIKYGIILGGVISFSEIRQNPSAARFINVDCTKRIIAELIECGLVPVFTSSESVFDGIKGQYLESDATNPQIEYAKQKVEIEEFIKKNTDKYLILRVSKIYSSSLNDHTLVSDWIRKLSDNETIQCADDNIFCPIHINDLCELIYRLISKNSRGVFHLCSQKAFNRKEMLNAVLKGYNRTKEFNGKIKYRSLHAFKGAENQPLDTSMIPSKVIEETQFTPQNFDYWADYITKTIT